MSDDYYSSIMQRQKKRGARLGDFRGKGCIVSDVGFNRGVWIDTESCQSHN